MLLSKPDNCMFTNKGNTMSVTSQSERKIHGGGVMTKAIKKKKKTYTIQKVLSTA